MDPVTLSVVVGLAALEFGCLAIVAVRRRRDPLQRIERIGKEGQREMDRLSARYKRELSKAQREK